MVIVERDYILGYILGAIGSLDTNDELVFKGGTALRKVYFPDYRFSEDLDFTYVGKASPNVLNTQLQAALDVASRQVNEYADIKFVLTPVRHKRAHPGLQQELSIHAQYPWHPSPLIRIKLEITRDEPVLLPILRRPIIHVYDEPSPGTIASYSLEEVIIEKLRTLLQTAEKLRRRSWSTRRGRDYYDLWRILREHSLSVTGDKLALLLKTKTETRDVVLTDLEDFFSPSLIADAKRSWIPGLGAFVADLPPFEVVISELREMIKDLHLTIA